jgi:hypothetical protein
MQKEIKPITTLINGDFKTINSILLTNFFGYDFSENAVGNVEYALGFLNENKDFVSLQNASIQIPKEILAIWGNDDNVIIDYIIKEKNY